MGTTDTHNICTRAKVDKVGSPWQWHRTLLPVWFRGRGIRFLNTSWVKRNGIEGPLSISIWSKFFLRYVLIISSRSVFEGEGNVMCLLNLSVTFFFVVVFFFKISLRTLEEILCSNAFSNLSYCFVWSFFFFFHRRDYIKEVWSNSEAGASTWAHPGCLVADCSSGGTPQLLPIALCGCGELCLSSAGNRKFPVCGNHPVWAQADRHWVFKEYRYPRKLLLLYMERYEWISLCTPCYILCTFCAFIEYKNRSPLKFCLSSLKNYLFVKFSYKLTASTWNR